MNKHFTTKKIIMAALMAALTVAGSALRIKVPSIVGTSAFHLGNIMCALAGILLGPFWGGLAAGLGSAIYDMFDPIYISEAWITFITKYLYGMMAGLASRTIFKKSTISYPRALLGAIAGALTYAFLYLSKTCFYSGMLMKGLTLEGALWGTVDKLPATTFNVVVAIVAAPLLAISISSALKASKISLE